MGVYDIIIINGVAHPRPPSIIWYSQWALRLKNFKPSSKEPVVRIQGIKQENNESDSSSSDGDGSDDSNLYYEFDSDEADSASHTTKSTTTINKQ